MITNITVIINNANKHDEFIFFLCIRYTFELVRDTIHVRYKRFVHSCSFVLFAWFDSGFAIRLERKKFCRI